MLRIQKYDVQIKYVPGKDVPVAVPDVPLAVPGKDVPVAVAYQE
jgi:hypothetical protein